MTRLACLLACGTLGWLVLGSGCAAGLESRATARAERQLHCKGSGLRMRPIGVLELMPSAPLEVELFEASGCDQERVYFCMRGAQQRCDEHIAVLPRPDAHPALERAVRLLRTTTRSRCPGNEQRIVQESESLFRFEACDGKWLYHCRANGCERLP